MSKTALTSALQNPAKGRQIARLYRTLPCIRYAIPLLDLRPFDEAVYKRAIRLCIVTLIVLCSVLVTPLGSINAQGRDRDRPELPAALCGLVNAQVACFDMNTAKSRIMSPADQRVIDFSISPGSDWLAYRTVNGNAVIASMTGDPLSLVIDPSAVPPAEIETAATTLSWSPDGMVIAYVTANGFRVAFPPLADKPSLPPYADRLDRSYINLRFSPRGSRLAAQSDDGNWAIFTVNVADHTITRTRTIDQAGEVAWFNEDDLAVALLAGGLFGTSAIDGSLPPRFNVPNEHFIKMMSTSGGEIVAIHPDPGDTIGSAVSITHDGVVTSLGDSKVDSQVRWGPDGQVMLYIGAGTPILVDRATGAEDMLPVRNVSRVVWSPPMPKVAVTVQADADLYYLSPDESGTRQLWQYVRDGKGIRQITAEVANVDTYAVSPDKSQVAYVSGGRIIVTAFASMNRQRILAYFPNAHAITLGWRSDGLQLAYSLQSSDSQGGLYVAQTTLNAGLLQPTQHKSLLIKGSGSAALLRRNTTSSGYTDSRFSPDGRYILTSLYGDQVNQQGSRYRIIDLQKPSEDLPAPVDSSYSLMWAVNNLLLARSSHTTPAGTPSLMLTPVVGGQTLSLVEPGTHVGDVRMAPDGHLSILRAVGWFSPEYGSVGPNVVQSQLLTIEPDGTVQKTGVSPAAILPESHISPSGFYAAGILRGGPIREQDQLLMLDVRSGQVWRVSGANRVSMLQWVE
jgi:Tol biopolymer transport system component